MIEAALRTLLISFPTVTAIVGTGTSARIRPYKLWQKDELAVSDAIIIRVNTEEPQNDLSGSGGQVMADVSVLSCSSTLRNARTLAECCRTNLMANPAEGLEAFDGNMASVAIGQILSGARSVDFIFYGDDSDEGYYVVDAHYSVTYTEAI